MNQVEKFIWLNTAVAIFGTYLNAKQKRFGFILWMITNAVFCGFNIYIKTYPQAFLFAVYFGLALFGYINWGKVKKESEA
jgi:nicotinamide riboside transporter PnuC